MNPLGGIGVSKHLNAESRKYKINPLFEALFEEESQVINAHALNSSKVEEPVGVLRELNDSLH